LTLTDADSGTHELRVTLSAFVMLTDTCDSSLCHEVTLLAVKQYVTLWNVDGIDCTVEENSSIFSHHVGP